MAASKAIKSASLNPSIRRWFSAATTGKADAYRLQPFVVSVSVALRWSLGTVWRSIRPLATKLVTAREVRARSSWACSANADDDSDTPGRNDAITRHSRRVMPSCPSKRRITEVLPADSRRVRRYSNKSSIDCGLDKLEGLGCVIFKGRTRVIPRGN